MFTFHIDCQYLIIVQNHPVKMESVNSSSILEEKLWSNLTRPPWLITEVGNPAGYRRHSNDVIAHSVAEVKRPRTIKNIPTLTKSSVPISTRHFICRWFSLVQCVEFSVVYIILHIQSIVSIFLFNLTELVWLTVTEVLPFTCLVRSIQVGKREISEIRKKRAVKQRQ